jgi:hypothetical protein
MSASKEIETLEVIIENLLRDYPKYRESDRKLICRVWAMQLSPDRNVRTLTTYDFFDIYSNSDTLSPSDSITRVARMVKTKYPELEGKKDLRLEEVHNVKEVVKNYNG